MSAIVVAVDFSEPSRKAFQVAVGLAQDLDLPLVLVHAFGAPPKGAAGLKRAVLGSVAEAVVRQSTVPVVVVPVSE